ncbi:acyltransferase [Mucilaginibacter sp. CAU 1740]|uniref:acyltransferase n=1 Tax=Mucilaginibacter sp. CAU 1740 TaxID=3140365 RepID=UPI00325AE05A
MNINESQQSIGKPDLSGKIFSKLHYLKIDINSVFQSFFNNITWKLKKVNFAGPAKFYGFAKLYRFPGSIVTVGEKCAFRSDKFSNLIGVNRSCIISTHSANAIVKIGNSCGFSGVSIGCLNSITIGDNVLLGANVIITDFDWHNVHPQKRRNDSGGSKPVVIGDNVFIGVNSIIWKGVTIGKNSVIGANSLVTKDVPENTIYGGNPAKFIKELNPELL